MYEKPRDVWEALLRELEKQIPEVLALLKKEKEEKKAKAATGG